MKRFDLIIDALESAHHTNETGVMGLTKSRLDVALAAVRELRDAESKKAQWGNPKHLIEEAVAAEREACAQLCESEGARIDASWESCAEAIRGRQP